ncbi:MAG: glycosyltransferase [Bryobacteraceae bacterium]
MKVLHVLHHSLSVVPDGYAVRSQSLLDGLRLYGVDVVALTAAADKESLPEAEGAIRHWRTPRLTSRGPLGKARARYFGLVKAIRAVIEKERPDIVHVHSPVYIGLAAAKVARECRLPCVYEMRAMWEEAAVELRTLRRSSVLYSVARLAETRLVGKVDAVVTICDGLRENLLARGVSPRKVTVVPNAVSREMVRLVAKSNVLRRQFDWPDGPSFGFIGSLFHYEGVDRMLDVVPQVLKELPAARFLIVGGGKCENDIRERVRQWKNNEVIYRPYVPHSEIEQYYGALDCLVYPRRSTRLTELVTPLKPLEAMAMNRAVIASDVGGHRELIEHDRTGWLFSNDDEAALGRSMIALAGSNGSLARIAANGHEFVSRERTWDGVSLKYLSIYDALLAAGKAAP